MKRTLFAATVLVLLLPDPSWAQSDQPFKQGGGGRPPAAQNRPGPGRPGNGPPTRPQPGPQPGPRPSPRPTPGPGPRPGYGSRPGYGRPPTYIQPLPPRGGQFWHRGQYYGRVPAPPFAYPRGFGYRRWTIGARLPPLLFAPAYFYPGYAQLGLQAPPPGYSWVRYGPDLVLVNLGTGEVEDVIYGAFQ